jgi:hypothetical protein
MLTAQIAQWPLGKSQQFQTLACFFTTATPFLAAIKRYLPAN